MQFKTVEEVNRYTEKAIKQAIDDGADDCEARRVGNKTRRQIIASQPWLQPGGDVDIQRALQAEGKAFKVFKNSAERDKWMAEMKARSPAALERARRAEEEENRARIADPNHARNPNRIKDIVDARAALLDGRRKYNIALESGQPRHKFVAPPSPQTPEEKLIHRRWDDLGEHFENTTRQIRRMQDDIRRNPDMLKAFVESSNKCLQEAESLYADDTPRGNSLLQDIGDRAAGISKRAIFVLIAKWILTGKRRAAAKVAQQGALADIMGELWDMANDHSYQGPKWQDIRSHADRCMMARGYDLGDIHNL